MGRNVCSNKSATMLVGQIQYVVGFSGNKAILYHLDYINKFKQYYYPTVFVVPKHSGGLFLLLPS